MAGRDNPSFRVLGPFPPFQSRITRSPVEFFLQTDFSNSSQARRFLKSLLGSGVSASLDPVQKSVSWKMPLSRLREFSEKLKRESGKRESLLASQMEKGAVGILDPKGWALPGGGRDSFPGSNRTLVMGIFNVTPESFSDGGRFLDPAQAAEQALRMQEEGADWIDVGGESTRPGAVGVSAGEEKKRVLPVLKACAKALKAPLSIDTSKAEVALAAVGEGARMINDVGALRLDPRMGKTAARLKVPVVLMHMKGRPRTMQRNPRYGDVVAEITAFFRERVEGAVRNGVAEERIILDPGFGFGKEPGHNIEILRRLWELKVLGRPLMLGPSRKSTLGFLLGGLPPSQRGEATGASVAMAVQNGVDFVRVHDVKSAVRVVKIADVVRYQRGL